VLWEKKLSRLVKNFRTDADIPVRLKLWNGQHYDFGNFAIPLVTLRVNGASALPYLLNPDLSNLGEAYISGKIDVEGKLTDIIEYAYSLAKDTSARASAGLLAKLRNFYAHTRETDKQSIQAHYDVSNEFYQLWLDERMVYSCGYFENGDEDLGTAQLKKIDHILTKIQVKPNHALLDIGCGWGSLVIRAAEKFGARCVGVTLSQNQFDLATARVKAAGLENCVEIRLQDYRDVKGTFDRITSVGMYEHVGRDHLVAYFAGIRELLSDDGVAMNHGITLSDPDAAETAAGRFIDRYVFPDGDLPHVSRALHAMQRGGLEALDVENLRHHYARTLDFWADNFESRAQEAKALVSEEKFRIWRIYLAGCAYAFRRDDMALYQIVCCKSGRDLPNLPWSRRYMYE
jgi:cyclopropane-fatty-acyl-phospholipid synthase